MIIQQKNFLQHAQRKLRQSQLSRLILKDDVIETASPLAILQLLVSQFACALSDSCLQSLSHQPFNYSSKLPIPMVFAISHQQLSSASYHEALKLFSAHVDRKNADKTHIFLYNIAKINERFGLSSKVVFYLETVLKEQPFFPPAVFDLSLHYTQHLTRTGEALSLLQRHLCSINSNNSLIHSSYISCCSTFNSDTGQQIRHLHNKELTLTNYFNLGLLLRKKGHFNRAFSIFSQVITRIQDHSKCDYGRDEDKDKTILMLCFLNLIKIKMAQSKIEEAAGSVEFLLLTQSSLIDPQTLTNLKKIKEENQGCFRLKTAQNKNLLRSIKRNHKPMLSPHTKDWRGGSQRQSQFLAQVQCNNTRKLKNLLNKQKSIDHFFKNNTVKNSGVCINTKARVQKSLINARQQLILDQRARGLEVHESRLALQNKNDQLELNKVEMQEAIRLILRSLQDLKGFNWDRRQKAKACKQSLQLANIKVARISVQNVEISYNKKNGSAKKQPILNSSREVKEIKPIYSQSLKFKKDNQSVQKELLRLAPPNDKICLLEREQGQEEDRSVKMKEIQDEPYISNQQPSKKSLVSKRYLQKLEVGGHQGSKDLKHCKPSSYKQIQSLEAERGSLGKQIENTYKEQSSVSAKPPFDPLASSFCLTNYSSHQFRKVATKKGFRPQPTTLLWKSDKRNQLPKVLSSEFHQQMGKASELEKKQDFQGAYQKLLEIYKQFKQEKQKVQTLLRIGALLQRQEKYEQAERTYLKCSKFNSSEAFLWLGSLQLKIGKIEQGVENLEKANCIKRFDISIENKLVYGYSLREETMDKALKLAHSILKKEPNSLETLLITAGILEKQGLVEEAIQIVRAIDQVRQTEHIKHYLGILHLTGSNLKQAFNCFRQALRLKPDYVPSLIETASIVSQDHPKQAIAILRNVLQISPGNRKALARLGKIYQTQSDFDHAMATYKAALETQQNYESYIKIGDCLSKKESYIEALLNFKEALNMKKTPEAFSKLGLMYQLKNDFSKAIENYQSALRLLVTGQDEERKDYLLAIGRLHLKQGQFQTTISSLEQLLERTESVELFKLLGQAYFGNKQYSQSLAFFQKANSMAGGSSLDVLQSMAMCLDRMEEFLASKVIYQKVLQRSPGNVRCLNNLGNILLITGQTNEAFYLFETLLEKVPKNLEKRLKLADIYAEVGDWSKVQYHLLQCNRQRQNDPRILQKLVVLFKEKRDNRMANKYEKKLALIRAAGKNKMTN